MVPQSFKVKRKNKKDSLIEHKELKGQYIGQLEKAEKLKNDKKV